MRKTRFSTCITLSSAPAYQIISAVKLRGRAGQVVPMVGFSRLSYPSTCRSIGQKGLEPPFAASCTIDCRAGLTSIVRKPLSPDTKNAWRTAHFAMELLLPVVYCGGRATFLQAKVKRPTRAVEHPGQTQGCGDCGVHAIFCT